MSNERPDNYTKLCTIVANHSKIPMSLGARLVNGTSGICYRIRFEVILLFGLTELKAQLAWKEDGVEIRYAASYCILFTVKADRLPLTLLQGTCGAYF